MSKLNSKYLNYKDELYTIQRVVRDFPDIDTSLYKRACNADKTLRRQGFIYFIKHIPDAEVIEFTPWDKLEFEDVSSDKTKLIENS